MFDQGWNFAQDVGLAGHQSKVDHVSNCVPERQNFGRDAAAGAAYCLALSPPFAPCPER